MNVASLSLVIAESKVFKFFERDAYGGCLLKDLHFGRHLTVPTRYGSRFKSGAKTLTLYRSSDIGRLIKPELYDE